MSTNIQPSRIKAGLMTLTGTTNDGSSNILKLVNSTGNTIVVINSLGNYYGKNINLSGKLYSSGLTNGTTANSVYYNTSTKELTYGNVSSGSITGVTNLGTGNGRIYSSIQNNNIQLKSLSGGSNISLTCNNCYIAINATTINWCGSTVNGVTTYVNSNYACSNPNMTFDGNSLSIIGNAKASTYVCSPIITGSTRICSPIICGTSCVQSPIICASTCFIGSGAGLTGTASSLTAGSATNAACLGGQLAACYARKDQANTFTSTNRFAALTGTTICASTCFIGSGAGLTGTALSLTAGAANNANTALYLYETENGFSVSLLYDTGKLCLIGSDGDSAVNYADTAGSATSAVSATNTTCLGGQLAACYARKDTTNCFTQAQTFTNNIYMTCLGQNNTTNLLYYDQSTGIVSYYSTSGFTYQVFTNGCYTKVGINAASNDTGINTVIGACAGLCMCTGINNTLVGFIAGRCITSGCNNVIIGEYAGIGITTGCNNVLIGECSGIACGNFSNQLMIGIGTTTLIYGDFSTCNITLNGNVCVTGNLNNASSSLTIDTVGRCSNFNCVLAYGKKEGKTNYLTLCFCTCTNGATTYTPMYLGKICNYVNPGNNIYFSTSATQIYEGAVGVICTNGCIFIGYGNNTTNPYMANISWIE